MSIYNTIINKIYLFLSSKIEQTMDTEFHSKENPFDDDSNLPKIKVDFHCEFQSTDDGNPNLLPTHYKDVHGYGF